MMLQLRRVYLRDEGSEDGAALTLRLVGNIGAPLTPVLFRGERSMTSPAGEEEGDEEDEEVYVYRNPLGADCVELTPFPGSTSE